MYLHPLMILLCAPRALLVSASYVPTLGVPACLGCATTAAAAGGGAPNGEQLEDLLKTQKIEQRLRSIRQQLDSSLRVHRQPHNAPKLPALPQVLVDRLIYSMDGDEEARHEETSRETKQVVLFPEEVKSNCHPTYKSSVCLKFVLSDDILLTSIYSANLWFNKEQFPPGRTLGHNFTIIESTSKTENPSKLQNTSRISETNGWYQKEITSTVRSWTNDETRTQRTISILCTTCNQTIPKRRASKNKTDSPFLLLNTEMEKSTRSKRGVDCHPGSNNECCRESLEVDLRQIKGYEMVYHPLTFNAYMCRGNCYFHSAVDSEKPYATLLTKLKLDDNSKFTLPTSCCTPNRFADLPVFFASSNTTLMKIKIPNMIVESCGCI